MFILISLTCVSATDDNQTDTVTIQEDTISQEILTNEYPDEGNFSSLNQEIINSQESKYLELNKNYTYDYNADSEYIKGVEINIDDFVIDGKGFTVNGFNIARIFNINANNVTLKNINFINGKTDSQESGGAVFSNKDGNILNCNFTHNAASYFGGAIYIKENGNIANCNFKDNNAGVFGGAIMAKNGTITNCIFTKNQVRSNGGAISIEYGKISNCNFTNNNADFGGSIELKEYGNVTNCYFKDNRASDCGGAIDTHGGTVENSIFINNTATKNGGAIYSLKMNIINCNFTNNHANYNGGVIIFEYGGTVNYCNFINNSAEEGDGGALYIKKNGVVNYCNFTNNHADNNGGVIRFYNCENEIVSNCNFKDNYCNENGGAVYFEFYGIVENSNFINNHANNGGAVFFYNDGILNYSNFISNHADNEGGAIYIKHDGNISNCDFTNNTVKKYGGAVFFYNDGIVKYSNFINNTASTASAGAVCFYNDGILDYCNFINNTANYGGALYLYSKLNISNTVFKDNKARGNTNIIYLHDGAEITLINNVTPENLFYPYGFKTLNDDVANCTGNLLILNKDYYFTPSIDSDYKQGIVIDKDNFVIDGAGHTIDAGWLARIFYVTATNVTLKNINFINGNCKSNGGAIYFDNNGHVINCNFTDNYAESNGGAIYFKGNGTVENSIFTINSAYYQGGAIYFNDNGTVENSIFTNNSATFGGAIVIMKNNLNVSNTAFKGNIASGNSFNIFLGEDATITLNNVTPEMPIPGNFKTLQDEIDNCIGNVLVLSKDYYFTEYLDSDEDGIVISKNNFIIDGANHIIDGSGMARIFKVTGTNVTLKNINFVNGYANYGGAIYFSDNGAVTNCTFNNNKGFREGGAIYFNVDGTVTNCTFNENHESDKGGAIYANRAAIINSTFTNNRASEDGGAIYIKNDGIITNCTFTKNIARNGGAIYIKNGNVTNCTFTKNNATNTATVWIDYGTAANCTFIDNFVENCGGAICLSSNGNITHCNFINNKALYGGAIYLANNGIVEYCNFINNEALDGGAVTFEKERSIVDNCNFIGNRAYYGGAICFFEDATGGEIINCYFKDNSADYGGAIYFNKDMEDIVFNCNFQNNIAHYYGGAIYSQGTDNISHCNFQNNIAHYSGGAIYSQGTDNISHCNFQNNIAYYQGGAIYSQGTDNISHCNFTSNAAWDFGGAITLKYGLINNSIFKNNKAIYAGAVLGYEKLNISNSIFLNNTGINVIYSSSEQAIVTNSWFGNNATDYDSKPDVSSNVTVKNWLFLSGVANPAKIIGLNTSDIIFRLYAYDPSSKTVSEYNFPEIICLNITSTKGDVDKSTAKFGETIKYSATSFGTGTITATFENIINTIVIDIKESFETLQTIINNAEEGSTIILDKNYFYNEGFTVHGVEINKNLTIDGNGHIIDGANSARIFHVTAGNVVFKNITLINANLDQNGYGAAIWVDGKAIAINCTFNNNYADYGAAIANGDAINCTFNSNNVKYWGGAIFNGNAINCTFNSNSAYNGGAIYQGNAVGCIFNNNNASGYGGAVYTKSDANANIYNCIFINNIAKDRAGAVYLTERNGVVCECIFVNNTAKDGGAIYSRYDDKNNGIVCSCIFMDNIANNAGGAIYWETDKGHISDSIFINNRAGVNNNIYWKYNDGPANGNYNWFGNTALNYNARPDGLLGDTWLFLNATSTSEEMTILGIRNVIFKLYAYNETSNTTSEYDNTLLKPINLTITVTNGGVDKNTAQLGDIIKYSPLDFGKGNVTATFKDITCTIEIDLVGEVFDELQNIIDSAEEGSTIILDKDYSYNDGFSIDGIKINKKLTIDGNGHIIDARGEARIFYVKAHDVVFKNITLINGYTEGGHGGAISSDVEYATAINCTFNNNNANHGGAISKVNAEDCIFNSNNARHTGGAIYQSYSKNCIFNSNSADEGGAQYGGETVNCTFNNNNANYGGAIYESNAIDSTFNSNTANESGGAQFHGNAMNCVYNGNDANLGGAMYNVSADSCIFKTTTDTCYDTTILSPILTVENSTFGYNSSEKLVFNFTTNSGMPIDNANILISVYYKDNNTWVGNYSCMSKEGWVVDLPRGTYLAVFNTEYAGFTPVNATVTVVKGNSTLTVPDITFDYGATGSVIVTFTNAIGISAEVTGHSEANVTVNGNIIVVSNLNAGTYTLSVTTITDENYNNVTKTATITVNKVDSSLTVGDVEMDYGDSVNVVATTEGATGITAKIDGKEVIVIENTIQISGLNGGTHSLNVTTIPDANHNPVTKTVKITVNKLGSAITAENRAYVINYGGTYSVTVKDAKGNVLSGQTVTFTLNGKNIGSGVTNANGVASITLTGATLKTAKAGTRNLVVNFAGGTNYNGASKTVKITINKEKTKMVAKKKTFKKAKKVKKYTITLKNSKNKSVKKVKVTLKVKGKTYSAKTNSKGKATFKIKKLTKKGTYKAKVTFKGNAYYKKVTKTVKIKIK